MDEAQFERLIRVLESIDDSLARIADNSEKGNPHEDKPDKPDEAQPKPGRKP